MIGAKKLKNSGFLGKAIFEKLTEKTEGYKREILNTSWQ